MCFREPLRPLISAAPPRIPPIRRGMRMVMIRKLLARMRSIYSRFAISHTLCIDFTSGFRVAETSPDVFDEDLFKRGLDHFKPSNIYAARDCSGKHMLACGFVAQQDVGVAGVVLGRLDAWVL